MKYFVFSDVHGCFTKLCEELEKAGFDENNPNHLLISLGDNFDRGASIHNRFLTKAKAEAVETYSQSTENACVYKKFLNTKGI